MPSKQAFSHAAFPLMRPPASRMRVTTVASIWGVHETSKVPFVHGMPATAMLSLIVMVRPSSSEESGLVLWTVSCEDSVSHAWQEELRMGWPYL